MRSENTPNLASENKSAERLAPNATIGLILDQDTCGDLQAWKEFTEELGVESGHVMTLAFLPKKTKPPEVEGMRVITVSGVNWLGKFKSKEVNDFLSHPFDMLISYQRYPSKVVHKLVTKSKAKFKVGRLEEGKRIYDLAIIISDEGLKAFTGQIKKYLRIFK